MRLFNKLVIFSLSVVEMCIRDRAIVATGVMAAIVAVTPIIMDTVKGISMFK